MVTWSGYVQRSRPSPISGARAGVGGLDRTRQGMKELMEIASLRARAASRLQAIAEENGADSILYRSCREAWFEREAGADLSVISGDLTNAIVILDRGLHVLVHGPEVLKKDGLALADVVKLIRAA